MDDVRVPIPVGSTRFMDQLRADMRARGYALNTAYCVKCINVFVYQVSGQRASGVELQLRQANPKATNCTHT